ncbi:MAG TPA: ABC-F family ATP-binding cassette domain-containing protein [Tepidisphaeraceae bacterium]|jgi:ATP-binding cassette subfamily F protein 3|nr:ABC-F family ATP-binding cassette domain-containing protein [Tepidisphaeraceae bacterium]
MAVASLSNIEKDFGERILFDKVNLTVYEQERIGLIGANGSGKTTLFKILTGEVTPDSGDVGIARNIRVGYLTQDPVFDASNTVIDEAELAFAALHDLSHRLRELEHDMAGLEGDALQKVLNQYQTTQHEFDLAGGYAWQHRLEATLLGVGLEREAWEQNIQTLSGGQRSRLALAKLLISEPDLLLLDEPTNHLDLVAIEWLEHYLMDFKGATVLISHDRFLLDRLATRILWLRNAKLDSFKGNYSAFVQQRELIELSQQRAYELQQEDIAKQQEFIRRFQAGQRSKEARGRNSRLQRLLKSDEMIQAVSTQRQIRVSINSDQRAGDQVLTVRNLSKAFGDKKLWQDISFLVRRGERIGVIGPNGSGKTTLLKVLLGQMDADDGNIKWGANLNIGYYDQRLDEFDPENSVMEEVAEGRSIKDKELRDILALMLFRNDDVHKQMSMLSGGERARVRLAQLLVDHPNVLLMDEPTNHLDIASREAVEAALKQYDGTVFCVSHDRFFLDQVVNRLFILKPPGIVDFDGNYSSWQAKTEAQQSRPQRTPEPPKPKPAAAPSRSAPRKDKKNNPYMRPFGRLTAVELEKTISETESALAACQTSFANPDVFKNPAGAQKLQKELDALQKKLKELEQEYFNRQ